MKKTARPLTEVYRDREKEILEYVSDRIAMYDGSECKKKLKNRMIKLDDSIDMRFSSARNRDRTRPDFKSKIAMPLVREKQRLLQGLTLASFRNDPMVSVFPEEAAGTTMASAKNAQDLLGQNFRRTRFREKAWRNAVMYGSRYGVAVMVSNFQQSSKYAGEKTLNTPFGIERMPIPERQMYNVFNRCINPLNYGQNPSVTDPDDSDYQFWVERIALSQLIADYKTNSDVYIEKNLKDVIQSAKKQTMEDSQYFTQNGTREWNRVGIDRFRWYGYINIEGYEEDETCYYVEKIGDKIVRFGTNPHDENLKPVSIFCYDPRLDFWWGNTPVENSIPMENILHLLLGARTDQALKNVMRVLFMDSASGVDVAAINNQLRNGGVVQYDFKGKSPNEIFYEFQGRDLSSNAITPLISEIKEADSRLSFENDFSRSAVQGGPQNKTATAAMMMDEKGNVLKSDILESFSYGLQQVARFNLTELQLQLPDNFILAGQDGLRQIYKGDVLGYFQFIMHTSLTKNKVIQQTNRINFLTALQNFRGTQDPAYMNVKLEPFIREWIKDNDFQVSMDEVMPPIQQQMIPMQQNGVQAQAVPAGGMETMGASPMAQPQTQGVMNGAI